VGPPPPHPTTDDVSGLVLDSKLHDNTNAIVIGGSGFLGSHVTDTLSEAEYEVTIFDLRASPWLREGQKMVIGDIMDTEQLAEAIDGADYVYQLAGIADISEAASNPKETIKVNILGSTNVIEACIKCNVSRLIFASSQYTYTASNAPFIELANSQ